MFDESSYDHDISRDHEIKRRKAEQARVRRNRRTGLAFEEDMFEDSSRHLILFPTLTYKKRYREDVMLGTIQHHRDRLFRHIEDYDSELLHDIRGLIWKLEEGKRSGLHLHLLVFYRGDRRADVPICRMLGEYWEHDITKGWGDYWNSNAHKADLQHQWGVGLGQVNRHNDPKRDSLRLFIENYMAKSNQVPKDRTDDDKLFGVRYFSQR
ncbi:MULTISPECIES: inovirus-type Gp2 protein [unclassified Achromobacter]|uniref:rolling circle replication-associated protein n=1 Tax=unclassified Achromobacter TaxID=2626865 RepID=UPI000B516F6B|nr:MULTISPECIES: inovirus-type Gp2 protein [unclassified Achromobacter]OWT72957.1 hypothetical protein CEY05_24070 [Achromobacter sp. HZ34]OWT74175.1 hypothetical protein CEY04_22905 [Achromobacter sp. HZ28]